MIFSLWFELWFAAIKRELYRQIGIFSSVSSHGLIIGRESGAFRIKWRAARGEKSPVGKLAGVGIAKADELKPGQ